MSKRFSTKLREYAAQCNRALFAVDVSGKTCKPDRIGGMELTGSLDQDDAAKLFLFAALLQKGKTPWEAFEEAWGPKTR